MRKRIGLIKSVIKINGIKRREFLIIVKGRMGGILNLQRVAEEVLREKSFTKFL